eukprot:COSAG05_NODE_230_length_13364_cov_33.748662_2_plen_69_part_00
MALVVAACLPALQYLLKMANVAMLSMSAAEPWQMVLTAARRAAACLFEFFDAISCEKFGRPEVQPKND